MIYLNSGWRNPIKDQPIEICIGNMLGKQREMVEVAGVEPASANPLL